MNCGGDTAIYVCCSDKQLLAVYTPTHNRLAAKTEQYEAVQEKLHHNEQLLSSIHGENSKKSREGSSRLANLNQALMKVRAPTFSPVS